MRQPPLLPEETLSRVLRLAKFDGLGGLVLGTIFALVSASSGHFPLTVIGLLAAGAGAIELHGIGLLRQGDRSGMNWLIASQPLLLLVILSYCALRLWFLEMPPLPDQVRSVLAASAAQWRMSLEDFLLMFNRITYGVLALAAVGFQGGMMIYYLRRREPVAQALIDRDESWP
jgi:hypothetical protein